MAVTDGSDASQGVDGIPPLKAKTLWKSFQFGARVRDVAHPRPLTLPQASRVVSGPNLFWYALMTVGVVVNSPGQPAPLWKNDPHARELTQSNGNSIVADYRRAFRPAKAFSTSARSADATSVPLAINRVAPVRFKEKARNVPFSPHVYNIRLVIVHAKDENAANWSSQMASVVDRFGTVTEHRPVVLGIVSAQLLQQPRLRNRALGLNILKRQRKLIDRLSTGKKADPYQIGLLDSTITTER